MGPNEDALKIAARRAYERGRFFSALRALFFVVPATVASAVLTTNALHTWIAGGVLAVVAVVLRHRGGGYARGVAPGLAAGLIAAVFAMGTCHFGVCIPSDGPAACAVLCLLGGGIAGGIIARRAAIAETERRAFLLGATSVAFLAGALGCTMFGLVGVAAMLVGTVACAVPLAIARAR